MALPATIVSDGPPCFATASTHGAAQEKILTDGGKECVKEPRLWCVNTILSNVKTAFSGTYHAFDFRKYAHRFLGEVQYKFNRRFDLENILARLVRAVCQTQPHSRVVIRAAEVGA